MTERGLKEIVVPEATSDGAGVRLKRSIATQTLDHLDPFFLFDHFGSERADDYIAGFPMHPHRGIETITYMLDGSVSHKDSMGNSGVIGAGDVQWMTAGSGILHEEMPRVGPKRLDGFQILGEPAQEAEDDAAALPGRPGGADPRGRAGQREPRPRGRRRGERRRRRGPGDLRRPHLPRRGAPRGADLRAAGSPGHTALLYVYAGEVAVGGAGAAQGKPVPSPRLAILGDGDVVRVHATAPARFLLLSAQPLHEPYVRWGPFVMNTKDEIAQALQELRAGTFIRP